MEFDFCKEPGKVLEKENIKKQIEVKLSVVTPFYNAGTKFWQTYNCMMNQSFTKFEWIIVNDGSSDKTSVEVLEKLVATDARIRLFHQENGGQSKAKNYAIKQAVTDVIVFLDADDLIEPFYLELLYEALLKHPDAAWAYTDLVGFEAVEYIWCKHFSAGRMTFNNILVNAAAFRKSCIETVGGFPEIAKHYDEDWALYLLLLGAGYHPVHIPVIGFWYRKSQGGMQQTVRKDEALRRESDEYINCLAKHVNIHCKEEIYHGELPKESIKSEYSKADQLLAKILNCKIGIQVVKMALKFK